MTHSHLQAVIAAISMDPPNALYLISAKNKAFTRSCHHLQVLESTSTSKRGKEGAACLLLTQIT